MKVELHPHQKKAVDDMHNGCVLVGDVGTGKTITALAYALLKEPGRDIYVITTAKKRDSGDWQSEAAKLAVPYDKIIVDSWNNIKHYHKVYDAIFIFDEQRLVGNGAWVKTFYDIARKNRWVLLSATPGDTWLDYVPVFIANGFYKNVTEFRQEHVIYSRFSKFPKVERYVNPGLLQRRRQLILVEMPVVRETVRHIKTVECDYDQERFDRVWKKRWNVYEDEPIRDAGELFRVGRKVVNSDSSRLRAVQELMSRHPRLIVFYNFDYELEQLRTLGPTTTAGPTGVSQEAPTPPTRHGKNSATSAQHDDPWDYLLSPEGMALNTSSSHAKSSSNSSKETSTSGSKDGSSPSSNTGGSFAIAEWNGHKHEEIPKTDRWVYLVQYLAGAEGWNCIETDAMVFYSLTYSYKQFYQAQGRIDRMNTLFKDLYYYVLTTRAPVDRAVWRALNAKKDFNLRGFKF